MDGADARASQHGDRGFGHHGQIDENAVAFSHAVSFEHVGKPADFAVQLPVRQHALLARLAIGGRFALPNQRRLVRRRRVQPFV